MAKVRNRWLRAFQDLGYSPKFISTEQIEKGELARYKVFVMPNSRSLSEGELKAFLPANKPRRLVVFFDTTPGLFDKRGKPQPEHHIFPEELLGSPPCVLSKNGDKTTLGEIAGSRPYLPSLSEEKTTAEYSLANWVSSEIRRIEPQLKLANAPEVRLNFANSTQTQNPRMYIHRYKLGNAKLIAIERNINWQMSEELKQKGGNEALGKPIELEARFAKPAHVYDLRAQKYLGETDRITFTLDPWQPSLFALLPERIPAEQVIDALLKRQVRTVPR